MCQSQPCIEELDKTAMKEEFETTKAEVEGDECDEFLGRCSRKLPKKSWGRSL